VQNHFDYLILGGGLSGLNLAMQLEADPFFKNASIAIIEATSKTKNDRTWCFWEQNKGRYEDLVSHRWEHIQFKSAVFSDTISIAPFTYKKIESEDFYAFAKAQLKAPIIKATVLNTHDNGDEVVVTTDTGRYTASKAFSSIPQPELLEKQKQQQYLKQHFIGWFIKTTSPTFDAHTATFMDFTIPQKGNCRFMYVLPTSTTEALFEYTLFSKELLPDSEYEAEIAIYLKNKGITKYQIERTEQGNIPMSSYRFEQHNSENILYIGSAGGWTKASTGFTFQHSMKRTQQLLEFLKKNKDLRRFKTKSRFWWYDLVFVDVLYRKNSIGATIFGTMFKKNPTDRIFRFLDNETRFEEELQIMWSLPKVAFIKGAISRFWAMFR
jgi:lycopene beta-cyclase